MQNRIVNFIVRQIIYIFPATMSIIQKLYFWVDFKFNSLHN